MSTTASTTPTADATTHLRAFLLLHSRRAEIYSTFHAGFRTFMNTREAWEEEEERALEERRKQSTTLTKHVEAAATSSSAEASKNERKTEDADDDPITLESASHDRATLESIASKNDAERKASNPELIFQRLCASTMIEFQGISAEVRAIIAQLVAQATNPTAVHFASLLASLQQLEKLKFELTLHQQMLLNQQYVLAHPRQHGQLQEHSHHVHSVTDEKGRVREHPSHKAHKKKQVHPSLGAVGEDEEDGDDEHHHHDHEEEQQELADNDQPFTRHLSALLSNTAFQTDSPFLFPPSGAAPAVAVVDATKEVDTKPGSTLHPHISEEAREKHQAEMKELKQQEYEVVEKINEIVEEVRMETMEGEGDDEE